MEQGSSLIEKEDKGMMNVEEVARAIEWVKAMGLTEADACNLIQYIATGVGLPNQSKEADK